MQTTSDLAIDGGPRAVTCGPFAWPPDDEAIREALQGVWRDGDWGRYHGPRTKRLAAALAEWHALPYAHLCSSGTIAVELALRAVGVQAGDAVVLAGYDFAGNFRAIEAVGATPVLVDTDPENWSLHVDALAEQAQQAQELRVRAVVVSHLHGGLADMESLCTLAAQRGWQIVEDACQAVGANLSGKPAGAWGDVGVLSFGGSKLLTAGRGGALLTSDASIAQRLKMLTGRGNDAFPLSELQAAVLLPQLAALANQHARRESSVEKLRTATSQAASYLRPVAQRAGSSHAFYKWASQAILPEGLECSGAQYRQRLIRALQAEGAPIDAGFRGFVNRSDRRCRRLGSLEASGCLAETTLLVHHPVLLAGEQAIQQVGLAINKVAESISKNSLHSNAGGSNRN